MKLILLPFTFMLFGCTVERHNKIIIGTEIREFNFVVPDQSPTSFKVQYECSWN